MYLAQSQRKIGVKCSSCRVRGQKCKLSHRHSELGSVKGKKKLGMFRPAHCSLYTLCPQEREREKLIPLFSFSLQQFPHQSPNNGGREICHSCLAEDKLEFCLVWKSPAVQPRNHLSPTSNFPWDVNPKKPLLGWWGTDGQSSVISLMLTWDS